MGLEPLGRMGAVAGVQVVGRRIATEVVRKGDALLAQALELRLALGDQVVFVDGCCRWRLFNFRHHSPSLTVPASATLPGTGSGRRRARRSYCRFPRRCEGP